jgi:hypothetical protein
MNPPRLEPITGASPPGDWQAEISTKDREILIQKMHVAAPTAPRLDFQPLSQPLTRLHSGVYNKLA